MNARHRHRLSLVCRPSGRPHRRYVAAALCAALAAAHAPATGADWSLGIAAGPAQGRVECVDGFPCDRSASFWKASAAWQGAAPWDAQIAAFGAAKYKGGDRTDLGTPFGGDFRVLGLGATAGYRWSFARDWSVVGRLGGAVVKTRFSYADPFDGSRSKTRVAPLGGIGLAYEVTPTLRLGLDYDETRFEAHTRRGSLRMFGAAVQFSF